MGRVHLAENAAARIELHELEERLRDVVHVADDQPLLHVAGRVESARRDVGQRAAQRVPDVFGGVLPTCRLPTRMPGTPAHRFCRSSESRSAAGPPGARDAGDSFATNWPRGGEVCF
eukprot:8934291-Pyramimonas_sp.AAC.1